MNTAEPDGRCATALAPEAAPESSDVAVCDLTPLCAAVSARLELLVGEAFLGACTERGVEPTALIRAGVLECVAALRQLHTTLAHEIARRPPLDVRAIPQVVAMLAREPVELITMHAAVQSSPAAV